MTIKDVQSSVLAAFNAAERRQMHSHEANGSVISSVASCSVEAGMEPKSTLRFGFIHSGARIQDIRIQHMNGPGGRWQMGVYNNHQQSGVANFGGAPMRSESGALPLPSADRILSSGVYTKGEQETWRSIYSPYRRMDPAANQPDLLTRSPENACLRIWELLNLDRDPGYSYHLTLTCIEPPTHAGQITMLWEQVR